MTQVEAIYRSRSIQFKHQGFWAITLTLFLVAYNVSVMPAIMAEIVQEFESSVGSIQGILVVFSLVTASFAPTTENLCRFFGRTRIFSAGLLLYGIGITLTCLSPSVEMFAISFALLTGLAATPLISTPWAIADLIYEDKAEEYAILSLILASTLGTLAGALLGGFIASRYGWRWAFAPSLSVLMLVALFRRSLPNLVIRSQQPIDWVGGLLSFLGLGSIFVGIGLAGEFGWWRPKQEFTLAGLVIPPFSLSIVPTLIAVGVITLGLFAFWQRRQAQRNGASLLQVGLLREREFVIGIFTAMLHTLITTGIQFNLYQYVPVALSLNPFRTALTIIPYNLTMPIVLVAVVKYLVLGSRIAPKYIVCSGISLLAAGMAILYVSLHPQATSLNLLPGLIVMGLGSGLFMSYISALTYSAASLDNKPQCPGIYNPIQNLGSSLGRGILGTSLVFFTSQGIVDGLTTAMGKTLSPLERLEVINRLQEMLQTLSRDEMRTVFADTLPPDIYPLVQSIALESATDGIRASLLLGLMFAGICFLLSMFLPRYLSCRRS